VPARWIVDASPRILLSKAGRLDLLRVGAGTVVVPAVVCEEIVVKGPADPTARALASAAWLDVVPVGEIPGPVAACRLDRGETAVLALAHGEPDCEVVLDDLAARRAAASLGVILLAKREGVLPAAHPTIEELRKVGLYLDDDFVADVLKRVGE
jgi:predicted nucleic acid-binding protein